MDEKEFIKELKEDKTIAPMIENNMIDGYKIRIVYRGEGLFYHDTVNKKAFICNIQITTGVIFIKTINRWDDRTEIINKEQIIRRIQNYFLLFQKIQPIFK